MAQVLARRAWPNIEAVMCAVSILSAALARFVSRRSLKDEATSHCPVIETMHGTVFTTQPSDESESREFSATFRLRKPGQPTGWTPFAPGTTGET